MFLDAKSSEIQEDSLMLGIRFGMNKDQFFKHCESINSTEKIFDSATKLRIGRPIKSNGKDFMMNLYPTYLFEKINKLEFECYQQSYSKWNKTAHAENILTDIKSYFEKEFQIKMEEFNHEKHGKAYVHFKGNRRLRIFIKSEKLVGGEFLDMTDEFKK